MTFSQTARKTVSDSSMGVLDLFQNRAFVLIILAFVVYNANLRSITSFDTNPTRYLPISILREFDLD